MSVKIRKYYDYDACDVNGVDFTGIPSMVMSEFQEESDLNNIVDRNMHFKDPAYVTKMILAGKMSEKQPVYGDFVDVKDYQESLNVVLNAKDQFNMLPSKVRDRFHNDPAEMLAFCNDTNNLDEGVSLGLFDAVKVAEFKKINGIVNKVVETVDTAGLQPETEVSVSSAQ